MGNHVGRSVASSAGSRPAGSTPDRSGEDAAASTAQADTLHDAHRREAASLEALEGAMRATIDEVLGPSRQPPPG